jgi:hypothetical protein
MNIPVVRTRLLLVTIATTALLARPVAWAHSSAASPGDQLAIAATVRDVPPIDLGMGVARGAKGPNNWSGKHPPQSGVTELNIPFAPGAIKVLVPVGVDIHAVMAKYGLSGAPALVNHPPFSRIGLAAGLDRQWRVPVPAGREKEFVKLLALHPEDSQDVELDWVDQTELDLAPTDSLYVAGYQGNLDAIGMQSAWDVTVANPSVVVAFIGTGIRASHEDLRGKQVTGHDFSVSPAVDIAPGTGYDPCDHETVVAGAGAASTNNGLGIASTGFNVDIMPVKEWSDTCARSALYTRADAISWAFDHGAAVINLSYTHYDPDSAEANIIASVWQYGGVAVAAAGNDNRSTATNPAFPCSDLYVICAGASDNFGNRWKTSDTQQCFNPTPDPGTTSPGYCGSNFGTDVDYAAPGIGIWSTSAAGDSSYEAGTGTSISAPQLAGVIGLLKSTGCSPQHDQDALYATANYPAAPWTNFGFINAGAALHYFGAACPP